MREIRTRSIDPTDTNGKRIGAVDKEKGNEIKFNYPPTLEGREAHAWVAQKIVGEGERLLWDRELKNGYVFLVAVEGEGA